MKPPLSAIDFIVAGGAGIGLGHVVRSARLAREALRRGFEVRAFLEGDDAARSVWTSAAGFEATGRAERSTPLAPVVALDLPTAKHAWLERLAENASRPLIVDDARSYPRLAEGPPGWRVLPGLHHAPTEGPDARDEAGHVLLSGPRYAILPEAHRRCARRPLEGREGILVSLGGADPNRLGPPLARAARCAIDALDEAGPRGARPRVDVVFGAAFQDPGNRDADRLTELGCTVHHRLPADAMADRMRTARLAVIGFGTSLTELAWHGTPFLTVAHHDHDRGPSRDVEARGFGRSLGAASTLPRLPLETRILRALRDDTWQRESADAAHHALDGGLGAARLFDRVATDLALRPARHAATPNAGRRALSSTDR